MQQVTKYEIIYTLISSAKFHTCINSCLLLKLTVVNLSQRDEVIQSSTAASCILLIKL